MAETLTQTLNNGLQGRPIAVQVRSVSADGTAKTTDLVAGSLFIGTAATNDFVVEDTTASRQHAMLELVAGGVRVKDLGSRNGTWFLGTRIREAMVPSESTLRVGRTLLHIEPLETQVYRDNAESVVAASADMRRVLRAAKKASAARISVVMSGESGVGKERMARFLHSADATAVGAFVVVDCGALTADSFESTLFGHLEGAFPAATADQAGRLAIANGGTVFLKSVDELPLEVQPKLLRCLETQSITPVGATQPQGCVFRTLSSARQDLEQMVQEKLFRSDLFFRLAQAVIPIAPLRERAEDLEPLVRLFEKRYSTAVPAPTLEGWSRWGWPGNVRELENAVSRFALGLETLIPSSEKSAVKEAHLADAEKAYLLKMLRQANGKVSAAAQLAGISRSQFYRLMQKFGIPNE